MPPPQKLVLFVDEIVRNTGTQTYGKIVLTGKKATAAAEIASRSAPIVSGLETGAVNGRQGFIT